MRPGLESGKVIPGRVWLTALNSLSLWLSTANGFLRKLKIGEGNGNPLQYSCLENPMDRGA